MHTAQQTADHDSEDDLMPTEFAPMPGTRVPVRTTSAGGRRAGGTGHPVRFPPTHVLAPPDLGRAARTLLDDGFRLALVGARQLEQTGGHRVFYVFTGARPDRRIEFALDTDPGNATIPSLALLSFPAGTFERELYDAHGILATSTYADNSTVISPRTSRERRRHSTAHSLETQAAGQRLRALLPRVERVVPDAGFGHALAYCLAIEDAYDWHVPAPVPALRAILLELERVQNHLHALATMCARAGLGTWSREAHNLRQRTLRLNQETSGHRLLRGAVAPGGVSVTRLPSDRQLRALLAATAQLSESALSHLDLRETYRGRWILTNPHAAMTGALGFVARASGLDSDARRDHPFYPPTTQVAPAIASDGDALARLQVRTEEIGNSLSLLRELVAGAHPASISSTRPRAITEDSLRGLGLVEGPRGTIAHRAEATADGRLLSLRVVDPSFLNRSILTLSQRGPHDEHGSTVDPGFGLPRAIPD